MSRFAVGFGLSVVCFYQAAALNADDRSIFVNRNPRVAAQAENQRAWLHSVLTANLHERRQIRDVEERLARLTPDQLNQLVARVRNANDPRARLEQAQANLNQARAVQAQLQRTVARRDPRLGFGVAGVPGIRYYPGGTYPWLYNQRRVIGYAPNIVWLPSGTSLNVGATVSPDRRHVNISAQPFFSSVPAVHLYNLRTGQLQRIR